MHSAGFSSWAALLVIPVYSTVLWYLAGMATITRWLWRRYPAWLDSFVTCAACFGSWAGFSWFWLLPFPMLGHKALLGAILAMLWCTFWVPVLAWVLTKTLQEINPGGNDAS